MDRRPIGIDLFAGAGGMSLGFEQAGFDIAAAIELDPIHAAVHHFNFPNAAVLARSVVGLTGQELRCTSDDAWHFGYVRNGRPDILISRFFKLPRNGVSNTLREGTDFLGYCSTEGEFANAA